MLHIHEDFFSSLAKTEQALITQHVELELRFDRLDLWVNILSLETRNT